MIVNGNVLCPRCEKEKSDKELQEKIQKDYERLLANKKYNTLKYDSVIEDTSLVDCNFNTYITTEKEEQLNKEIVLECLERYKQGQIFNTILQGNQGAGKSHLAYALLHELNQTKEYSCLFVSVEMMIRKIKESFRNKESRFTEDYFVNLLSNVDFLALDDLGAETGAIDTEKNATDFVQRVLYAVTNARQKKATITTTNLSSKTLYTMYDKKLISRLFKSPKFIVFAETKDKRINQLPF
jgi:DNA replication protein DnaC